MTILAAGRHPPPRARVTIAHGFREPGRFRRLPGSSHGRRARRRTLPRFMCAEVLHRYADVGDRRQRGGAPARAEGTRRMARDSYSVSEAAKVLGVSVDTLRRWDRTGKIRAGRDS